MPNLVVEVYAPGQARLKEPGAAARAAGGRCAGARRPVRRFRDAGRNMFADLGASERHERTSR